MPLHPPQGFSRFSRSSTCKIFFSSLVDIYSNCTILREVVVLYPDIFAGNEMRGFYMFLKKYAFLTVFLASLVAPNSASATCRLFDFFSGRTQSITKRTSAFGWVTQLTLASNDTRRIPYSQVTHSLQPVKRFSVHNKDGLWHVNHGYHRDSRTKEIVLGFSFDPAPTTRFLKHFFNSPNLF